MMKKLSYKDYKKLITTRDSGNVQSHDRRYVDDIFVLFTSLQHLEAFRNFLNGQHAHMSFAIESEKQNRMSFLDVQIIREDKTFTTSVYRKPTFSRVYTNFTAFYLLPISLWITYM